jgi:hypothetical protein
MVLPFLSFPAVLIQLAAGPDEAKNLAGQKGLRLIQIRLATPSLQKFTPACQDNLLPTRIADSNSTNAVNFSSARSTRC